MQGGYQQPYGPPPQVYRPPPSKGPHGCLVAGAVVGGIGVLAAVAIVVGSVLFAPSTSAGVASSASASTAPSAGPFTSAEAAAAWPDALKFARESLDAANKLIATGKLLAGDDMLAGEEEALARFAASPVASAKDYVDVAKKIADRRKAIAAQAKPLRAAREKKIEAERVVETVLAEQRGDAPKRSSWDGAIVPVKEYLAPRMNDPDSLKIAGCTEPVADDAFWVVACDYRGKNAFGALVLNSGRFFIQRGQVVKVEEL